MSDKPRIVIDRSKFTDEQGNFDYNAYMREYMREDRRLKKMQSSNENKDSDNDNEKKDIEKNEQVDMETKEKKTNETILKVEPNKRSTKKGKQTVHIAPEQFAKFSVSIEKTSLMLRKDNELKPHEEKYIEESSMAMAELYEVPKLLVPANYAFSMVLPHITRFINTKTIKEELEIKKLVAELEEKGIKIDSKELMLMTKAEREKFLTQENKKIKLNEEKKKFADESQDGILLG